jgi:4-amino-4-deoxy-L-arabinose transferase-like glycosyltransferase
VQSLKLQSEGPATAFMFVAVGAALMWWKHPTGLSGYVFAILSAVALSLGILTKPFVVVAVLPVLLVIIARFREMRKKPALNVWVDLQPIAAAILAGAVTTLTILAPFAQDFDQFMRQVVTFHRDARNAINFPISHNIETLVRFFATNAVLNVAASIAVFVAILRRDWRIIPLAAWLLATLALLTVHNPLFSRHTIILLPPLIAIIGLGLNNLPTERVPLYSSQLWLAIIILTFATVLVSIPSDYQSYRDLRSRADNPVEDHLFDIAWSKIAAELERSTTPDQWVITDAPYVTALSNRSTPPWLVDSSFVRVLSGYLSSQDLLEIATDRRVHAVLFATGPRRSRVSTSGLSGIFIR